MGREHFSVRELAQDAGIDLDEAMVVLWDAGLGYISNPDDQIRSSDLQQAQRTLRLPTRRDVQSPRFWQTTLKLTDKQFQDLLLRLGFRESPKARTLPKGAIAKLKAEARKPVAPATFNTTPEQPVTPTSSPPPINWRPIGHRREIRQLTVDEVVKIHWALVEDFKSYEDPIDPAGVRSEDLLASAVFRPQTALGDEPKYPTVEMAAAALLHSLIHNHPFYNGNKRTALVSMLVLLDENDLLFTFTEDELFRFVLMVAQHHLVNRDYPELADREAMEIALWLQRYARLVERGDFPLPMRRFRRVLNSYGCILDFPGRGNRINITRRIIQRRFFFRWEEIVLKTQIFYGDEGREVLPNTIRKVREDLKLDEANGTDSKAFYEAEGWSPDDFIVKYQKILRRLARV